LANKSQDVSNILVKGLFNRQRTKFVCKANREFVQSLINRRGLGNINENKTLSKDDGKVYFFYQKKREKISDNEIFSLTYSKSC